MTENYPTPNEGKRYSTEEDEFIKRAYGHSDTDEIAEALGRKKNGVLARAKRLNLSYYHIPEDIPKGFKFCLGCKTVFPLDDFGVSKRSSDGKAPNCKSCITKINSDRWLKQKENRILSSARMEEEQAQAIMAELSTQSFVCNKCKETKFGSEFSFDKNRLKIEARCKSCKMENNAKNKIKRIKGGSDW